MKNVRVVKLLMPVVPVARMTKGVREFGRTLGLNQVRDQEVAGSNPVTPIEGRAPLREDGGE
jgi:hypothetical protein